jgi:type I restriction enzyme S subunit
VESGVPVIRGNNLTLGEKEFIDRDFVYITEEKAHELRNCEATYDDIIFTAAGTLGQVGIIPRNSNFSRYIISNKQLRLRVNKEIVFPKYVYYWFSSPPMREYIANQNKGSSVPLITLSILKKLPILVPPLNIQKKIIDILSPSSELVDVNLKRMKVLEELAQSIYDEWFIAFQYPGYENSEIIQTAHGLTPKDWKWDKIGNVVELVYGKSLKESDRIPGEFPVYGSSGIVGTHGTYLAAGPTVIVGRKGNVGRVHWSHDNCYPIDTVFYIKTKVSPYYVYFNFKNQNFIDSDAAVPGLSRRQAYGLSILIPSQEILEKFEKNVKPIFKQINILRKKNEKLSQTRDLLLPSLISGRVEIGNLNVGISGD